MSLEPVLRCLMCGLPLLDGWPKGLCPHCALAGALELADGHDGTTPLLDVEEHDTAAEGGVAAVGARFGNYELLKEIGRGGMGVVYRARQIGLNRIVALKMILAGQFAGKQEVLRFRSEAEAAANLQHPYIVRIHETGVRDAQHYFSMDYVEGRTLADPGLGVPLPAKRAARYTRMIAEAIAYAHSQGVLHRDLKPANVIIDCNDRPRITDFGLAKQVRGDSGLTLTGQVLGSPEFMPPEQATSKSPGAGPASDIYGIGALLYFLITGRPPFQAESIELVLLLLREADPVAPCILNPGIPRDLETICLKCLEKDPTRRYPDAQSVAAELDRFLKGEPIVARPLHRLSRLWRWGRRHPAIATLTASVLMLLLVVAAGAIIAAWWINQSRTAERAANRELRQAVRLLALDRAEDSFGGLDPAAGSAHLAALLRADPSDQIAASRLVSALVHRNWALPAAPPLRHLERVTMTTFSADGRRVLIVCRNNQATIRDVTTGTVVASLPHAGLVHGAHFSPDGTRIVTASADGTGQLWDAATGERRSPPLRHEGPVNWAEFSRDGLRVLTASSDRTVRIWNGSTGSLDRELRGHTAEILQARFSPDGTQVATATDRGGLRIWSVESAETRFRMTVPLLRINSLAFSPDGRRLVSAHNDGSAWLWDTATAGLVCEPLLHSRANTAIWCVAFSPDSKMVLTTAEDATARLWSAADGRPIGEPLRHEGGINFGVFSPDGALIATTSVDNSARLWEAATGRLSCQPLREPERIPHAAFSADGSRLVTSSYAGTARIWDIRPRRSVPRQFQHRGPVQEVVFSPDGAALLTVSEDKTARCWNSRSGQPLGGPILHDAPVRAADFCVDGRHIATGGEDGAARIWRLESGAPAERSDGQRDGSAPVPVCEARHQGRISYVRFSPDGRRFVTASADHTARVWDSTSGEAVTPPLRHAGPVVTALFSSDGRLVVTASDDRTARVWNAQTGEARTEPLQHLDHLKWAEFSRDGRRVVTASSDNTARIWDVETGAPLTAPLRHPRLVSHAAFSPDGGLVVTGSLDRSARIWDATTGQALTPPLKHESAVSLVRFAADGQRILTACWDGSARLWDAKTGRPLSELLPAHSSVLAANFDPAAERIALGCVSGTATVWELPPVPTPVPAWFPAMAEAVAGAHLTSRGHLEAIPYRNLEDLGLELAPETRNPFYDHLARWFFTDPAQRPAPPF